MTYANLLSGGINNDDTNALLQDENPQLLRGTCSVRIRRTCNLIYLRSTHARTCYEQVALAAYPFNGERLGAEELGLEFELVSAEDADVLRLQVLNKRRLLRLHAVDVL